MGFSRIKIIILELKWDYKINKGKTRGYYAKISKYEFFWNYKN
jgi:hypothetical protein